MTGILNLYKPTGVTSHDMVYLVRRAAGQKRVGHTGTLDPCAEGVLPILLGSATKLSDLLTAHDKEYIATVRLGVTTDTYDCEGEVVSQSAHRPSAEEIEAAVRSFTGDILQKPPIYSALKRDGRKLYQLAREGKTVEIEPRPVTVHSIRVYDVNQQAGTFRMAVHCSKGTYIRSLCHDIGQALGCGAAMAHLIRSRSGGFSIEDSIPADEVRKLSPEELERRLLPADSVLKDRVRVTVGAELERKLANGLRMRPDQFGLDSFGLGQQFRIYSQAGALLCLSEVIEEDGIFVLMQVKSFRE